MKSLIFSQDHSITPASNQPIFSSSPLYTNILADRDTSTCFWKTLKTSDQEKFNNKIEKYLQFTGCIDLKDPRVIPSKNLYLMSQEVQARLTSQNNFDPLPIEVFQYEKSSLELLESIENIAQIKEIYKVRKRTVKRDEKSGLNTEEASKIRNCLRQGRDLFMAGKNGTLMVKPLNFFYSITAYTYAIIILNNPLRFCLENIPGSHGLNFDPRTLKINFGGDAPKGTLTDLITSHPTIFTRHNKFEILQDNQDSQIFLYKNRISTGTGTLLSMVPELRDYYRLTTGNTSRTHPLDISQSSDRLTQKWDISIGDGNNRPQKTDIENSFPGMKIIDRHGKYVVEVPTADISNIKACLYSDIRGRAWYIENPFFPFILPEVCLHFLLSNAFSNIMRYSPDNWGSILLNDVDSDVSLITRRYLSTLESKIPIIMLRSISKYFPYIDGN